MLLNKKLQKKSVSQLKKIATFHFNKYIRLRDQDLFCVSCNKPSNTYHAGHYFSQGSNPGIKFNLDNVNKQCVKCNFYLHGNLIEYTENLKKKIGLERYEKLVFIKDQYKRTNFKWDRFFLIEIIKTYIEKNKNFNNY